MESKPQNQRIRFPWAAVLIPPLLIMVAVISGELPTASAASQSDLDFGDAPQSYPTLLDDDGARHVLGSGIYLGHCVDAETDGQPTNDADGDDKSAGSPVYGTCAHTGDEDGVIFASPLFRNRPADIIVIANEPCTLSAWMDFDDYNGWDSTERLFPGGQPLVAGANFLTITIPSDVEGSYVYARFRCTTDGVVGPSGEASDGEVEDYEVRIHREYDFGDAPDPPYPTVNEIEDLGAYHELGSDVYLGSCVDAEANGQPTPLALGDDANGSGYIYGTCNHGDDEDGVIFDTDIIAGRTAAVTVTANSACNLSAWIDFNADGEWEWDTDESLFGTGYPLAPGENYLTFTVPGGAAVGLSYARFRCTTDTAVGVSGMASDGEVEDYRVRLGPPLDYGDAPDAPNKDYNYNTRFLSDGARHGLGSGIYLGSCVDAELNGQPTLAANGDDLHSTSVISGTCTGDDDEDGVTFTTDLIPGESATIEVVASADCTLSAWLDLNRDGDWDDTGENLSFSSGPGLTAGSNTLSFDIPSGAEEGRSYARFRCSDDITGPDGYVHVGEVEDYRVRIGPPLDYGDAEFGYPTSITNTGAAHILGSDVYLGSCVDAEFDGQPSSSSDGDDVNIGSPTFGSCTGDDDEDGVTFLTTLFAGQTADVEVVANAGCTLSAWIDFNADGDWSDPGENLFSGGEPLAAGSQVLSFEVPAGAAEGTAQARFRCTNDGAVGFTGLALDGEVEDHQVSVGHLLDLGDVPDSTYPTLLANAGASHVLGSDVYLGGCVDAELDGQPTPDADGDDLTIGSPVFGSCIRNSDEDGVGFVTPLYPGGTAHIIVRAHAACTLSGWVDFDGDGDWEDAGESLFPGGAAVTAGLNPLSFAVPAGAVQATTYARLRCTTDGAVEPTGEASDGEVEDYRIIIGPPIDFGDAPDPSYRTLLASVGASHVLGSDVFLGNCVDAEGDGQPAPAANGDDTSAGAPVFGTCETDDDEDGVAFTTNLLAGRLATIQVVANANCTLSAWIDFNSDGDWTDGGENLFPGGYGLAAGPNSLSFPVPPSAVEGLTYARFRCTTHGAVPFIGPAPDGEVEDYQVHIGPTLDWGDAPEPYATHLEVNGPRHALGSGIYLGACVDAEQDGQPSIAANEDDVHLTQPAFGTCVKGNDEDGVIFAGPLVAGETADIEVVASAACVLSAWIDFNSDGDWDDADEDLFPGGQPLIAGTNPLTLTVPAGLKKGDTYARFRCTGSGVVEPTGAAPDGEVEDYRVSIVACYLPLIMRDYPPAADTAPIERYGKE